MGKTYIYIMEDGSLSKGPEPTKGDFEMVEDGLLDIIDPASLKYYQSETNSWEPLEFLGGNNG